MISIFKKINKKLALLALTAMITLPSLAMAQDSVSLTVSPTIFDMTADPGQVFSSTVRIINVNPYELSLEIDIVDFVPRGETGTPRFITPTESDNSEPSLARWITTEENVTIPAEKTLELPFTMTLPIDAAPGGHFAAFMIKTKATGSQQEATQVQTSQVITSLIFLRVSGDISESSSVRSFRTTDYIISKPEATFELRIENKGNVHVRPQGEIKIFNMWGQERGVIPVNQQTLFGNVLPHSVRKYSFTWTGQWSPTDIGRYTAVTTLGYGLDEKQFMTADTAFWLIPWKLLTLVILVLVGFVALINWAMKLYIGRMLALAGVQTTSGNQSQQTQGPDVVAIFDRSRKKKKTFATVVAPLEVGILDLRSRLGKGANFKARLVTLLGFIKTYWKFFLVLLAVVAFVMTLIWFVKGAITKERDFAVTIEGEGQNVTVSSDDMEARKTAENLPANNANNMSEAIFLVNRSGDSKLNEKVRTKLSREGYQISDMSDEEGSLEEKTVIVYDPKEAEIALKLSKLLDNALLSSFTDTDANSTEITIYLGTETIVKMSE